MKKSLIFSFNVLTLLIVLVLDNNQDGSCDNKPGCLSACKKRTEPLGVKEINTGCIPGKKCGCYIRCPT
ncbi:hypothetical protein N665_0703s0008 [Sinapis alba]|nr:hypothetical protein N665_0703s0008 [Sinapis alba]